MGWPAIYTDLNPIDNVWDALRRVIAALSYNSEIHPNSQNGIAVQVGVIPIRTHKLCSRSDEFPMLGL